LVNHVIPEIGGMSNVKIDGVSSVVKTRWVGCIVPARAMQTNLHSQMSSIDLLIFQDTKKSLLALLMMRWASVFDDGVTRIEHVGAEGGGPV
jgi:hypothetical protein